MSNKFEIEISFWALFKSKGIEVLSDSTAHGIKNVFKSQNWLVKIFWLILYLGGCAAAGYYSLQSIVTYFDYPVSVAVSTIYESPALFPAITICNLNIFDISNQETLVFVNSFIKTIPTETYKNMPYSDKINSIKSLVYLNDTIGEKKMKTYSFDLSSMLISCKFNDLQCTKDDFVLYTTFDQGNCYIFNFNTSNRTLSTSSKTGHFDYGLSLELFSGIADGVQDLLSVNNGFYLAVTNNSIYPQLKYEGIHVSTGYTTNIGIQRSFYYSLPSPFSSCRENIDTPLSTDSDFYKKTVKISRYTRNLCFEICFQYKFVMPNCNCSSASIKSNENNLPTCVIRNNGLNCLNNQSILFSTARSICDQDCPETCERVKYSTQVSMSNYPTSSYYQNDLSKPISKLLYFTSKPRNATVAQIKAGIAMINVYYDDLHYTLIQESPLITSDILLGSIGGQLGLFIGVSLLSFFEICEFFIEVLTALFIFSRSKQQIGVSKIDEVKSETPENDEFNLNRNEFV